MFMFRSKRNNLIKRLWRARVSDRRCEGHGVTEGEDDTANPSSSSSSPYRAIGRRDEESLKSGADAMLKQLKESQLELLLQAVESGGADFSDCVLVPPTTVLARRRVVLPHVLCCQVWRWTDLKSDAELKRLPCCQSSKDSVYICCNPYHWSRRASQGNQESPPPPYSRIPVEMLNPKSEDRTVSEDVVSQETGGTMQYGSVSSNVAGGVVLPRREWCRLAYWEHRKRVGRLFPVFPSYTHVFSHVSQGEGMCLATLATQHPDAEDAVKKARDKIGLGLTLSQEEDGVWIYNRSDHPVFVNSPTLDPPNSRPFLVFKVLPGYSIKIFDYARTQRSLRETRLTDGPYDPNAVRISFAKGWGSKYSRQFVTSCPCWLEILLDPCR